MNQCVPSWELDENPSPHHPRLVLRANSNSNSLAPDVPTLDYEVAELTWENGQLAMHGLGPPRLTNKATPIMTSPAKYSTWDKPPPAVGTLESIVNQATTVPQSKSAINGGGHLGDELVSWFENNRRSGIPAGATASVTLRDALVPCTNQERFTQVLESLPGIGTSTRVGSCSGAASLENGGGGRGGGREVRQARVTHDWSSRPDQSVTGSATCGLESGRQLTLDTCERDLGTAGAAGFTSTSLGSPGTTSSAGKECTKSGDEHDSVCRSRNQREARDEEAKKKGNGKLSVSTKRTRAAAIHNQSERKRRDKINQRMKTLQKLVPNSSKTSRQKVVSCQDNHLLPHKSPSCQTDKASMLDEVIEYLKQLQAQVQMMSRMNMSSIMLPLAMQQQLQMSMMAPMGLGVNMGMGLGHHHIMDMNTMAAAAAARPNNIPGMSPVLPPAAFVTAPLSWDCSAAGGDRLPPCTSAIPDPLSAFLACQSQPLTMDAYTRMAALYQQFQQQQQQQQQQLQCPTIKTKVP